MALRGRLLAWTYRRLRDQWAIGEALDPASPSIISSVELHTKLAITQKLAWFMLHRLREACGDENDPLSGIVEIDETCIGGKQPNKHEDNCPSQRFGQQRGPPADDGGVDRRAG